jgi:hypothetical protein
MNVHDVGRLSLGEWVATVREWNRMRGNGSKADAPSEDELEAAMLVARGAG